MVYRETKASLPLSPLCGMKQFAAHVVVPSEPSQRNGVGMSRYNIALCVLACVGKKVGTQADWS